MNLISNRRRRLCVACALAVVGVLAGGAGIFVASGIYNVAASEKHFAITNLIIRFALRRSVAFHSGGAEQPNLDDLDLVRLGANHFVTGCAWCHGAPGQARNAVAKQMLPSPPPLESAAEEWTPQELLWIVRHGLKYTGMPAWSDPRREDEVWAVVAFLQRLPRLDAETFRKMIGARETSDRREPAVFPQCARCHGDGATPPVSNLVPALGGQSQAYLERALRDYAQGRRPSGIMQPLAAELDEPTIIAMSRHYAQSETSVAAVGGREAARESIERGRLIATEGLQARGVPACLVCHGSRAAAAFPQLAGQSAQYLAGQLRVWKSGLRDQSGYGAIMATIARRLDDDQVEDVAAYFATLEPAQKADQNRDVDAAPEERSP